MNKNFLPSDSLPLDDIPLSEYPRPLFQRDSYLCLNGKWDIEFSFKKEIPSAFTNQVIVPYPIESPLSGLKRNLKKGEYIYYKKEFSLEKEFIKDIVLLHFDGVDQECEVYLNNKLIKENQGGYLPFEVEIQDYLEDTNILIVKVKDDLDKKYCYGKQSKKSKGMWYTKVSGIWKSVWIESYNKEFFKGIKTNVSLDTFNLSIDTNIKKKKIIIYTNEGNIVKEFTKNQISIKIPHPICWDIDNPYLYHFDLISESDRISSYFALRTIAIKKIGNINRILLNNKPFFFHGLLDQGYFSDGIFTPKTYKKYEEDILLAKELGFNTLRKHIKIEPDYFYYLCDKLGILVFQDFVNNNKYHFIKETVLPTLGLTKLPHYGKHTKKEIKEIFINQAKETMSLLHNHPSVVYYTIFNEGWGQFDSDKVYQELKREDPSRIFDATSGWFESSLSDVTSKHVYFKKINIKPSSKPIILSEFGGYVYKDLEHSFNKKKTYGYKIYKDQEQYQQGLYSLYINQVVPFIKEGLCGCIYTQISDVEDETNGLVTYDRKVLKVNKKDMKEISSLLHI